MKAESLSPFALYFAAVLLIVCIILLLSHFLGQRHRERATIEPYESGIVPTGSSRVRLSARFYRVAIFFLIFDVEAVFLFAWAVAAEEVGWSGYEVAAAFTGVLLAALVYEWRLGILDWGQPGRFASRTGR